MSPLTLATVAGLAWKGGTAAPKGMHFDRPEPALAATGTPLPSREEHRDDGDADESATEHVARFMEEAGVDPDPDQVRPPNARNRKDKDEDSDEDSEPDTKPAKGKKAADAKPAPAKPDPKANGKAQKPAKTGRNAPPEEDETDEDEDAQDRKPAAKGKEQPDRKPTRTNADYAPDADDDKDAQDEDDDGPDLDALSKKYPDRAPEPEPESRQPEPRPEPRSQAPRPPAPTSRTGNARADAGADDQGQDESPLFDDEALDEIETEYGSKLAGRLRAANQQHLNQAKALKESKTLLNDMANYVRKQAREDIASRQHTATGFFSKLAKDGWEDVYGTRRECTADQDATRARVITKAFEIQDGEAKAHSYVTWEQALEAAHRQVQHEELEKRAERRGARRVEEQIQRRSRKRDLVFEGRSSGRGPEHEDASEDDRAAEAVDRWFNKNANGLARR